MSGHWISSLTKPADGMTYGLTSSPDSTQTGATKLAALLAGRSPRTIPWAVLSADKRKAWSQEFQERFAAYTTIQALLFMYGDPSKPHDFSGLLGRT